MTTQIPEEVLRDSDRDADDAPPVGHYYPCRMLEERAPRIGDVALCGWVKVSPLVWEDDPCRQHQVCVVCAELVKGWI